MAGLIAALLLAAAPRAAVSTIAYSLASPAESDSTRDGLVFGLLNGAWAAAMVLMPLLAGATEQRDGARAGYLAVILPSCVIAAWLVARSGDGATAAAGGRVERLRGVAARAGVGRLIARPDRSHRLRLARESTGPRTGLSLRQSRTAGRHPARTLGRLRSRRDSENRRS